MSRTKKIIIGIAILGITVLGLKLSGTTSSIEQRGDLHAQKTSHSLDETLLTNIRGLSLKRWTSNVKSVIEKQNSANKKLERMLEEDGWEPSDSEDPDNDLIELSPELLGAREGEIKAQIASNSFPAELLPRLKEIAEKTSDEETRYLSVEAIGRSRDPEAQKILIDIYNGTGDLDTRSQILGAMIPESGDDEIALFLFEQAGNPDLDERLREEALFPLAAATLVRNNGIPAASLKGPAKDKLIRTIELLRTGRSESNGG